MYIINRLGLVLILLLTILLDIGDGLAEYNFEILDIPPEQKAAMTGTSWVEGCPVSLDDLRYIRLTHRGFDDLDHLGELIIHKDRANEVVEIFKELYDSGFKIEKMRLIEEYNGNDFASMSDNNTSAFNCRRVPGTDRWSRHTYGVAIDINPVINPWITDNNDLFPVEGEDYLERVEGVPGMIYRNDVSSNAFLKRGWRWGGDFVTEKDYQHFDKMF